MTETLPAMPLLCVGLPFALRKRLADKIRSFRVLTREADPNSARHLPAVPFSRPGDLAVRNQKSQSHVRMRGQASKSIPHKREILLTYFLSDNASWGPGSSELVDRKSLRPGRVEVVS